MVDALLVAVIVTALFFDFTNGFHDTANSIATAVSTRAMTPRQAVTVAAVANLVGAFVTTAVAKTIGQGIIDTGLATEQTILAALIGAIAWNLFTWWLGLPSSSSHALIGGLIGAALVQSGAGRRGVERHPGQGPHPRPAVAGHRVRGRVCPAACDLLALLPCYADDGNRIFRVGQLFSSTWFAFTHGANDAQKTMGVIALALFLNGSIDDFYIPNWVKFDRRTADRRRNLRRWLEDRSHARPARVQH